MIIPIELRFKADKDTRSAFRTDKIIKSHDVNSVEFHITIEGLKLTDNNTAKVLSIFHSSKSQVNTDCEIVLGNKIIYKPDTKLISMYETVTNYVYVYNDNQSVDVCAFTYNVDLSKIDETALEVKEVYDQSYADLLADFEAVLNNSKELLQDDSVSATITEVSQARGSYPNLRSRLDDADDKQRQTTAQLAETNTEVSQARGGKTTLGQRLDETDNKQNLIGWELQNKTRKIEPMVTFVDDDAYRQVLTHLKPLSERYHIPFVVAAISDRVQKEVDYSLTGQELLELQNMGWEISSHTHTHRNLKNLSYQEQESELKKSKEILEGMGLNISTVCYPFGGSNNETAEIVRKYYRAGRTTDYKNQMNLTPLQTYDLLVTPLGAWFDQWSESPYPTNSLDFYKHQVDQAIKNNAWLIFMTHVGGNDQHDAIQQEHLEETIKYVLEKSIAVVTLDEGLNRRGNIVDIGRYYERDNNQEHFVVGADGSYSGTHLQKLHMRTAQNAFTNENKPKDFPNGEITYTRITYRHAQGLPDVTGGTLTTNTIGKARPNEGFAFQEFKSRNNNAVYRRYEVNEDGWSEWELQSSSIVVLSDNSVTSDSPISDFPKNKISYCLINGSNAGVFPGGKGGILTTNRVLGNSYFISQEYEQVEYPFDKYKRIWNQNSTSWSAWKKYTFS